MKAEQQRCKQEVYKFFKSRPLNRVSYYFDYLENSMFILEGPISLLDLNELSKNVNDKNITIEGPGENGGMIVIIGTK